MSADSLLIHAKKLPVRALSRSDLQNNPTSLADGISVALLARRLLDELTILTGNNAMRR
jgi:hypothetical protein